MENPWNLIKDKLKESLPEHAYNAWLEPIVFIGQNETELVLEVPNQFFYEWVDRHYKKQITNIAKQNSNIGINIKFTVAPAKQITLPQESTSIHLPYLQVKRPNLNRKYTFSTFIEGANNQFARAAAYSVADSPEKQSFNPLLIYGGVGLGKTHLLHAIGNHILDNDNNGSVRVVVASSEKFTLDFISAIQKNKTIDFSKAYRKADVLLIDDIQFFQKKEQTQEQFFHTFNDLYQRRKQIVLTSDRLPSEIQGITDRLLSRFESGLVVDIQPPDFETRIAILMEKAEQNGLDLPYDMVEFMATHIKRNVRELESTIIRLLAYSSLASCEIDFDLVKKVVRERVGSSIIVDITAADVIKRVAEATKIPEKDIIGRSRRKPIAAARQIAVYLCREILGASLMDIGMHFGGRDHTTILHACRSIEKKINLDQRTQHLVRSLRQDLTFNLI